MSMKRESESATGLATPHQITGLSSLSSAEDVERQKQMPGKTCDKHITVVWKLGSLKKNLQVDYFHTFHLNRDGCILRTHFLKTSTETYELQQLLIPLQFVIQLSFLCKNVSEIKDSTDK